MHFNQGGDVLLARVVYERLSTGMTNEYHRDHHQFILLSNTLKEERILFMPRVHVNDLCEILLHIMNTECTFGLFGGVVLHANNEELMCHILGIRSRIKLSCF